MPDDARRAPKWARVLQQDYSGFLYIASHPAFPGILKIGCTKESAQARVNGISCMVPTPYVLEHSVPCRSRFVAERYVHRRLAGCRMNGEFFRVELVHAKALLDQADLRSQPGGGYSTEEIGEMMRRAFRQDR